MQNKDNQFRIGNYRPIYLWGGPGTTRMNKLKFMNVPVDEKVHDDAHTKFGASIVVKDLKQNWIHLTYSWGFPPEVEKEDWASFEQGAAVYHEMGEKVFAYIQSSNCAYDGSFKKKDWYAIDPAGRKHYYYTGRYMTCFQNRDWINYLKERIKDAIQRGADGIFFDNLWYGSQPTSLSGAWLGSAGCYCDLCKSTYQNEIGKAIPELIDPQQPDVVEYIHWRAAKMTAVVAELSQYARELKPDVVISANDYDLIMRPSYLVYGIDFPPLAKIQDLTMIENFALPNWEPGTKTRFANNAHTIRNSFAILPANTHLSVLSYDVGIGFDPVYPGRRYLQGMAEAAALGASMTTKGTEYHDGEKMTLLTAPEYAKLQQTIGEFNQWLIDNQNLYLDRKNINPIALLHPGQALWQNWLTLAPIYFGAAQSLLAANIPWKVVKAGDDLSDVETLLTFTEVDDLPVQIQNIHVPRLPDWQLPETSFLARTLWLKKIVSKFAENLIRAYHKSRFARKIMDAFGMAKMITQTPLYYMPGKVKQEKLFEALPKFTAAHIKSTAPVLMDIWQKTDGQTQIHLVNYKKKSQTITISFPNEVSGEIIAYPNNNQSFSGKQLTLDLDIYAILILNS